MKSETLNPLVSIIIPVCGVTNYLKDAIDSAFAQKYKNCEVLVVDYGSDGDNKTEKITLTYGDKIRLFKNENGNTSSALNLGIKKMKGQYFSRLSQDCKYYPDKIEKQVEFASNFDEKTIIISDWDIVDETDSVMKHNCADKTMETLPACFLAFDRTTWLNGCAMLIPKSIFTEFGIFDETLKRDFDYEMWFRLSSNVKFKIMDECLLCSRVDLRQSNLSMPDTILKSDMIHNKTVSSLSFKDICMYFNSDIENFQKSFNEFYYAGYKMTSAKILALMIKWLSHNGEYSKIIKIFNEKVTGCHNSSIHTAVKLKSAKTKKRLMFFSAHWFTGGVERFLANLLNNLQNDYDIFLITVDTDIVSSVAVPKEVTNIKVSDDVFYNNYDFALLALVNIFDIDIAIGCFNLFEKVLDFYSLASAAGVRAIASNHEYYFYPYENKWAYHIIEKRLSACKSINATTWSTNFSTFAYNNYNTNGYLIANPNTFKVQENNIKNKNEKIILCIGRFNDYVKRIDRVLVCFKEVLKKIPDARLVLVGKYDRELPFVENPSVTINQAINALKLDEERIFFEKETNQLSKYYELADVLLVTSTSEGFGMTITEAACFGIPTVCNYIPGLEDIITDGENGYLTPQDDMKAMADRVCEILSNGQLRQRLGENAKKLVERFDVETISQKWKLMIETVLSDMPKEEKHIILNKSLNQSTNNYSLFSANLCMELNKVVKNFYGGAKSLIVNNENIDNINKVDAGDIDSADNTVNNSAIITTPKSRFHSYYIRLINAYKTYGFRITLKKVGKKIKQKLSK